MESRALPDELAKSSTFFYILEHPTRGSGGSELQGLPGRSGVEEDDFERATGSAGFGTAPSSVGKDADANTKCAAVDSLGEWFTTRSRSVDPRRPTRDCVVAVGATYRLSAERVAGDVQEVRSGDRETKPASRGAS